MSDKDLVDIAKLAQKNSMCNLTGYAVGAALLAKSGTVYLGTNVEDKTIPNLSNCAERVAIQNAISHGEREFEKIAIVGGYKAGGIIDDTLVPCGICLQYMLDFCKNIELLIYINGSLQKKKITDLLQSPFELN